MTDGGLYIGHFQTLHHSLRSKSKGATNVHRTFVSPYIRFLLGPRGVRKSEPLFSSLNIVSPVYTKTSENMELKLQRWFIHTSTPLRSTKNSQRIRTIIYYNFVSHFLNKGRLKKRTRSIM